MLNSKYMQSLIFTLRYTLLFFIIQGYNNWNPFHTSVPVLVDAAARGVVKHRNPPRTPIS